MNFVSFFSHLKKQILRLHISTKRLEKKKSLKNKFIIDFIFYIFQDVKMAEIFKKIKLLRRVTKDPSVIREKLQLDQDIFEIMGMINNNEQRCGLNSKCFDKFRKEEEDFLNLLECPDVEEGMFECHKCKSKKVFTTSKQTRRGDESTTVFAKCVNCKHNWVLN